MQLILWVFTTRQNGNITGPRHFTVIRSHSSWGISIGTYLAMVYLQAVLSGCRSSEGSLSQGVAATLRDEPLTGSSLFEE